MELALEGILETLLVGAIASLCLLSPLFLLVGHLVHFGPLQHLFVFLLYEERKVVALEDPNPIGDTARAFGVLVMVATLFGLGVLTESFSKSPEFDFKRAVTGQTDGDIRLHALEVSTRSGLRGGVSNADFASFASDYLACRDLERAEGGAFVGKPSPCTLHLQRAQTFYYTAKNAIFRDSERYQELSRHQTRIDFARAVASALALLATIWFAGALVALGAERIRDQILARDVHWGDKLLHHWLRLSGLRCLGSSLTFGALSLAVVSTWSHLEEFYDLRVYGYYVADSSSTATADAPAAPIPFLRPVPESAFSRIRGPDADAHFEPSGVERIGEERVVLVVNDKGADEPFVLFDLSLDNRLEGPGRPLPLPSSSLERPRKLESVHVSVVDGVTTVFAAGTFDRGYAGSATLYRFALMGTGPALTAVPGSLVRLPIQGDPCAVVPGAGEGCVIEGLTAQEPGGDLLLGVRTRGATQIPTFAVVRLRRDGEVWTPELEFSALPAPPFGAFGISGLEVTLSGDLLVLTSFETDVPPTPDADHPATSTVRGALWRLRPGDDGRFVVAAGEPGELLSVFPHKPEGVTDLGGGKVLVVFDDDAARKGMGSVPDTFALTHAQSVYTVVGMGPTPPPHPPR